MKKSVSSSVWFWFRMWSDVFFTQVEPKKFGLLANWQREYTMEDILVQLKKEMAAPHNR